MEAQEGGSGGTGIRTLALLGLFPCLSPLLTYKTNEEKKLSKWMRMRRKYLRDPGSFGYLAPAWSSVPTFLGMPCAIEYYF